MDAVKIIEPGPLTTIQDTGRKGYQRYGMPVAGAMDLFSYRVANLLAGNDDNAAALEFTLQGPKMEFLHNAVIAITGAETIPIIDNKPAPLWQTIFVKKGSVLSFNGIKSGLRGYVAIRGGVEVPNVLESGSTYLRANIGGIEGRKLTSKDIIPMGDSIEGYPGNPQPYILPKDFIPRFNDTEEIRVILGPQEDLFKKESIKTFLNSEYTVTTQSDRMGYRLEGPTIRHKESPDIISDGIPLGGIQVPGHGQPIIMLADRQTTGGYTKIATVISTDLNKIAQLAPGKKIKFKSVTLEEAHDALRIQESIVNSIEKLPEAPSSKKILKLKISGEEFLVTIEPID
ncbi:biotin-dependent carboxyltransferase family protein [Metallumcola ferriviriculae]|uniref:Biotin-dependent carboxyltransferase family protein n=1 Tax=Metallumcola ferriviriculae TaxID=3039180 RepID=A0AAU0UTQ1_9FIRM|nr:biotin-dependent carboxyltransferase family protein [Desulfitibacteraceae bacterium MK1]